MFFGIELTKVHTAIFEIIEQEKIPVFNPTTGARWPLPSFGNWNFRYLPMQEEVMPTLLMKAKERFKIKSAVLIHASDDANTKSNIDVMRANFEKLGVKILTTLTVKAKETNFGPQVATIRSLNPDAIGLSLSSPPDGGTFVKQLRERGVKAQIIGDNNINMQEYWNMSDGAAQGSLTFGLWSPLDERPIVKEWIKTWRTVSGKADGFPDNFTTAWYDATLALAQVMRNAKELTRDGIRQSFLDSRLETISGTVEWDGPGDVKRNTPKLFIWKDGAAVPWE